MTHWRDPNKYYQIELVDLGVKAMKRYSIYHRYPHHHHHYHHHHLVVPLAGISLNLCHHFSLSFITSGRSSGLHPVSSHSCCMYVRAGPQEYVTYELVPASQAVSCVSGSSNLDSFDDGRQVAVWVGALWGVTTRTWSILLATFLCNCRLASSPAVLLASKRCIHTAVSTQPLPGRNCVSFYRLGLISI